ncbi:MAG TPA: alpha-L-arabinofuranosidase C-terminal domain-containing protein [Dongiaceae bacterium]|nr:alpha-L-arabinofuranosidase C-terminal domain-containing protein [Dongiaceae bacterium]
MKQPLALALLAAGMALPPGQAAAQMPKVNTIIHSQARHAGKINPMLFGNFIELLDDVAPGMWAELLNDRSFEGIIPSANWCYFDGSLDICDRPWDPNPTWTRDPENPFNGARSARLTAGPQPASLTQSGLAARKGVGYRFSGYLRSDSGVKAAVLLKCLLPTGEWMTLARVELPPLSAEWNQCAVEMTSGGETDRAVFELRVEGQGRLWADKVSLMAKDNLKGWRPDVVEAVKEVRPAVIRWGGSSVDPGHYRWKNGIGDRDRRVPWRNENWGRMDPNDVGLDEFCQFCELTGVEPLICVSFADGPQSAADLVEYCNGDTASTWGARRAANGHSAPYRVKYWQIGNEINPDNPKYLDQFPAFIDLMKKADAGARIMTSFPGQKLLDRVGRDIAYVCPHHYTPDLAECERDFLHIAEMLDHTPGCAQLKLGVTEWNIDAGSWGLGRAKQATLEAALMNARYLHLLMRHSDRVEMACRSNLANSYCGAIIETAASGSGVLKRGSYYVMYLYSHHAKPVPLWLEQFSDRLDLLACGSEDRKSVVLFAVNARPGPVEFSAAFNGFGRAVRPVKAEAVCDPLMAGQPDVMNHWNAPERVTLVPLSPAPDKLVLPGLSATAIEFESE